MQENKIILYKTENSLVSIDVFFHEETFWLNQRLMAELFQTTKQNISLHLNNCFNEKELNPSSVVKDFLTTATDGKKYLTKHYNLDAIISVGYRINSKSATRFRQWATGTLKEFITKGFALNDEMLKNSTPFGKDYFDELLEKIKEIRASERRFYQKITDIYAQCSFDYNSNSEVTKKFFKTVQNKLIFAITGSTAPEIIANRANIEKINMGLKTWKNTPQGKVLKSDVIISKNYLEKKELSDLNHIVNMYLDYAENQARKNTLMSMDDWVQKLDAFLAFNEYEILNNFGSVTRKVANKLAESVYKKFCLTQDKEHVSDFDKSTKEFLSILKKTDKK